MNNGNGATELQKARYGGLAKTLREAIDRKGWSVGELNRRLGRAPSHASIYQYLSARCGPLPGHAQQIARALDIPVATLLARGEAPATNGAAPVERASRIGEMQIKFEITVPMTEARAVLRVLIAAGLSPRMDDPT